MPSFIKHPHNSYPILPSSLNAGSDEIDGYHHFPNKSTSARPYLGLRARLSQIWINRWTVLVILILCRILLATRDLEYSFQRARQEALEACSSVESVGSAMASMPHYLSKGVNALTADSITKSINGIMNMMLDTLDLISSIILFVINMFTQTYTCLITFAITGSLAATIELIEKVGKFMNETIGSATEVLASDTKKFQDGLNDFLKKIKLPPFLGETRAIPKIDLTGPIDALHHIKIDPTKMNAELNKLNASLPNFAEVQRFTEDIVKLPFNELGKLINDSKMTYTFDHSVFPVAKKKQLTFCSDNNILNSFFDDLLILVNKARVGFAIFLIVLAILFMIAAAYKEIRAWKKLNDRENLTIIYAEDRLELIYNLSHPKSSAAGIHIATKFSSITNRQNLIRWLVAYGTSTPALYVLSLGIAGLFSCLCQYVLLKTVEKEVPTISAEIGKFTGIVVKSLDDSSKQWAVDANGIIHGMNSKINNDVFGWVQTGTSAINDTIDMFTGEMTKALNKTFGGTVLYHPILEVMNCLVGLKIASVQKGLTWVHDKAHVELPDFKPDVFSLGAAASIATADPSDNSASFLASAGDITSDKVSSAVTKVVKKLQESVKEEVIISMVLILIWIFVILMGSGRVIFTSYRREKVHGEGGPPGYPSDTHSSSNMKKNKEEYPSMFPELKQPSRLAFPQANDCEDGRGKFG